MLRILGSANPFLSRRDVLRAGGAFGLSGYAAPSTSLRAAPTGRGFGAAKRIFMVYLQGAASQFETWDPKPNAPSEIRGPWNPISTSVSGVQICEHLPKLAELTDRLTIIRSMSHANNNHSNLYTLSGHAATDFTSETNPLDSRHHPFFGSVLDYIEDREEESLDHGVPRSMGLPWKFSRHSPVFRRAGPYGAFLGQGYDPVWTDFSGEATTSVPRVSFFNRLKDVKVKDPFLGVTADSRLRVAKDARLRPEMSLDRLNRRQSLLEQFDVASRQVESTSATRGLDRFQQMAISLITSQTLREALDIGRETMSVRQRYGMNLFGQSLLTGRRLLEAGCQTVSVFWDEYKVVNTAWDTHFNHFSRLKDELLPGFDTGMSQLLIDLESRGLLEDTLVLCLTEHGRTPRINRPNRGGGRDHWSQVYSIMMAGCGLQPGAVLGASDGRAAFVKDRPTTPEDILSTVYHLRGVAEDTTIPDRLGRPVRLTEHGQVVEEILA